MLSPLEEGKVYEVLLVTPTNVTPVGVRRSGKKLLFRLFPGRSFNDILKDRRISIQITNDAELLVRAALNLPINVEIEGEKFKRIKGLPGWYGEVSYELSTWGDGIGESRVLLCEFIPKGKIDGSLPQLPLSRADCYLIDMAVHFTRFLVSGDESFVDRISNLYALYKRMGGRSKVAEYIISGVSGGPKKKRESF